MTLRYRYLAGLVVFVGLLTACGAPAAAPAVAPRTYRIGYFSTGGDPRHAPLNVAFVEEMTRRGYVVNQNLTIEYRFAEGNVERLPELARDLAALHLDAVYATSEPPAQAMLEADGDLPIVIVT